MNEEKEFNNKIEDYIKLGQFNTLEIYKEVDFGVYLRSEEENDEVLLPKRYVPAGKQIGDIIEVFVYSDSEDRYVATNEKPYAVLGEFGNFEVVDTSKFGAFVDWGLPKNLFVPLSTQKNNLKKGDKVIGKIKYDEKTDRLFLDAKIGRNIEPAKGFERNDEVRILVLAKTPLGYKVIVNNKHEGMLFENEIFENIKVGDKRIAYVKNNREDGKLDCILQPIGKRQKVYMGNDKVLEKLQEKKEIKLNSKSDPEAIKKEFGISKKVFKAALQKLKERDLIEITEEGIKLK
jgi:predicted RNA-binding protein (virulence factor B family)